MGLPTAGNVVVTPDMQLLIMEPGHGGDDWAYEAILEHMSQADGGPLSRRTPPGRSPEPGTT